MCSKRALRIINALLMLNYLSHTFEKKFSRLHVPIFRIWKMFWVFFSFKFFVTLKIKFWFSIVIFDPITHIVGENSFFQFWDKDNSEWPLYEDIFLQFGHFTQRSKATNHTITNHKTSSMLLLEAVHGHHSLDS